MPPKNSNSTKSIVSQSGLGKDVNCRWSSEITRAGAAPSVKVILNIKLELRHIPSQITITEIEPVVLTKEEPQAVSRMMNQMPRRMMPNLHQRVLDFYQEDRKLNGLWMRVDAQRPGGSR